MKKILPFILVFLVIFLFLIGVYFYKNYHQNEQAKIISSSKNIEADENNFVKAQNLNNQNICLLIKDEISKNFCLEKIAETNFDANYCQLIEVASDKKNCENTVLLAKAKKDGDLSFCNGISDLGLKITCVEKVILKTNSCDLLENQESKNRCISLFYYRLADKNKDEKVCLSIPESVIRANCLSELSGVDIHSDVDADGLDFLQEIINNTNPNKADTDKDGYSDEAELKTGYNPDGTGLIKLVSVKDCNSIGNKHLSDICLKENSNGFFDYNQCDKIINQELKAYCFDMMSGKN